MKVTKIKTSVGEFLSPVSTELERVVERMRSEDTKKAADDMSGHIPYKQLFAQAVAELRQHDCLYWFTADDEARIQEHNRRYQQESSLEGVLQNLFEPATEHKKENFWQVTDIQQKLSKHLKQTDVPSLTALGAIIKRLHWTRHVVKGIRGYYLCLK